MADARDDQPSQDTASENDATTVARLEALARSPDPMGAAFGVPQDAPAESPQDPPSAPPPPPGTPGGSPGTPKEPRADEPRAQAMPDPDTASPEELRAYAKAHPTWAKALGLEVRDYAQRRGQELQREQAARQQAEQNAAYAQQQAVEAADQARLATEYYEAYYDEDDPRHLDALRFYAQLGVAPMEIQKVIGSPVVQQHVGAVANQYAQQAAYEAQQSSYAAAIKAASEHPLLGTLGEDGLKAVWEETPWPADGQFTPALVMDFYDRAYAKAGFLGPKAAQEFRAAATKAANTRVYGDYPPAEGSVVPNGTYPNGRPSFPARKEDFDPIEAFTRGFARDA